MMNSCMQEEIPQTYDSWKECITVQAGIPFTEDFIAERLEVLRDAKHRDTTRFVGLYGEEQLLRVISWFERAREEIEH